MHNPFLDGAHSRTRLVFAIGDPAFELDLQLNTLQFLIGGFTLPTIQVAQTRFQISSSGFATSTMKPTHNNSSIRLQQLRQPPIPLSYPYPAVSYPSSIMDGICQWWSSILLPYRVLGFYSILLGRDTGLAAMEPLRMGLPAGTSLPPSIPETLGAPGIITEDSMMEGTGSNKSLTWKNSQSG